jgi:mono/diheme cytochrome c family protein
MKRVLLVMLVMCVTLTAWVVWDNFGDGVDTRDHVVASAQLDRDAASLGAASADAVQRVSDRVAQGAYLARAGNCVSCHTAPGQAPYTGGRALETPFGKVYASNLTPDAQTGLGTWNAQHFWRALHHGRSKDGRLLAPAFPYNHTSFVTRADADALFAYFQSLAPVANAVPEHALRWPFGTQPAFAVWRSLYFKPAQFTADAQQSPAWNRGAYLVQGLGHCAACHSPRDSLGASGELDDLSGGLMPGANWYAPSLLSAQDTQLATTPLADIVRLLKTGSAPKAWVNGPMAEVVQNSTQHLTEADLQAMATYLQARAQVAAREPSEPDAPVPSRKVSLRSAQNGAAIYKDQCAQCHGDQGQGQAVTLADSTRAMAYPPLAGNRAVVMPQLSNLVQNLTYGGFSPVTHAQAQPFGMPPFVLTLSDRDMADVLTYIRQQWGNTGSTVTEFDVGRVRVLQVH